MNRGCWRILVLVITGAGLLFITSQSFAAGQCLTLAFTADSQVRLQGDTVLIVTHPSTEWDYQRSSKDGLDRIVATARGYNVPIVYLQDNLSLNQYFYDDCQPNYFVYSFAGEFGFDLSARHVISAGGHFEACEHLTIENILVQWASKHATENLRLSLIANAIYMDGRDVSPVASYYDKLTWFKKIAQLEKFTLGELLRVIDDEPLTVEFIKRYLATFQFSSNHRVVVEIEGIRKFVFQESSSTAAPELVVNFVSTNNFRP